MSSIRKVDQDKPEKKFSTDQLISAHPDLVPRISGRHTRDRISSATCFLDYNSGFGYCSLCVSTSQEDTLLAKLSFEKLADTHGVKVLRGSIFKNSEPMRRLGLFAFCGFVLWSFVLPCTPLVELLNVAKRLFWITRTSHHMCWLHTSLYKFINGLS